MLRRSMLLACGAIVLFGGGAGAVTYTTGDRDGALVAALAGRLPRTTLTAVDCGKIDGLCEIQAGSNLFYTDRAGRFLVIGRVYDMETRQDLTAARMLEISPEVLVGATAKGGGEVEASPSARAFHREGLRTTKVSLDGLPAAGAIGWGTGTKTVTVFSDFRCGYCQQLHQTLRGMNVRVVERPISLLGTRAISDAVICSTDRAKAVEQAYRSQPINKSQDCDTRGLDANEAFARMNGFAGTPVLVRSDGAVIHGFRPRAFLEAWLKEVD